MKQTSSRLMLVIGLFLVAVVWVSLMGLLTLVVGGRATAGGAVPPDDGSVKAQVTSLDRGKDFEISLALKVTDKAGNILENLTEQDIEVYEDGELVHYQNFLPAGKGAIRLSLVLDATRTMNQGNKWREAVRASRALLLMLNEHDQVGLHCFNDSLFERTLTERFKVEPLSRLHLLNAWDAIQATGLNEGTPLCKTVERAMDSLMKVSGRRAMIVLSDGMDTADTQAELDQLKQSVISKSQELKIPLYMVCTSSGHTNMTSLQDMANGSPGGQFYAAPDPKQIKDIFETIGKSLQNEYTLTYPSPNPVEDGLKRNVTAIVRSGVVGTQAKGDYNVPGVISTGSRRSGSGLGLGSMALVFASLTILLGVMLGFCSSRRPDAGESAAEAAPVAAVVPVPTSPSKQGMPVSPKQAVVKPKRPAGGSRHGDTPPGF